LENFSVAGASCADIRDAATTIVAAMRVRAMILVIKLGLDSENLSVCGRQDVGQLNTASAGLVQRAR